MMAVSLPTGFLNNSDTSMENANEGLRIYGSEDFLHSISKESMDQIRKTMLRHEELFKEQVQTLHYLYNIQKSAMKEIRKAIYSQAQVLTFDSETTSDRNCKLHTFIVDGKPLRPTYVAPQNHVGSHVLSLDPSCEVKGFAASSSSTSFWMNDVDAKTFPSAQSKPRREIDLERPPEDYMDDIEIQPVANCYQELDANSRSKGETKKFLDSYVEIDLSGKADCPNLELTDQRTPMSAHSELSHGIHQNCEQGKETKILEALACSSAIGNQNPLKASTNHTKESTCNHLPAAGHPPIHEESCLLQGKLTFMGQTMQSTKNSLKSEDLEASLLQVKGSCNSSSTQMCQSLESNCLITRSPSGLDEEEQKNSANEGSLSSNACPQSSSIQEQCDSNKQSNFCTKEFPLLETDSTMRKQTSCSRTLACQRSEDGVKGIPNDSNHGGNSIEFLGDKVFKESGESTSTFKSDPLSGVDHSEPAQMSQFEAGVQSEHEEAARLVSVSIKSFHPSSARGFSDGLVEHNISSNSILRTTSGHGEPATVTKSDEETRDESNQEEVSECIAARILLSFVPDRAKSNTKGEDCVTCMEAEPSITNIDVAGHERKRTLRARRAINYCDGGVMDETLKWTRSLQGRRTLRKH